MKSWNFSNRKGHGGDFSELEIGNNIGKSAVCMLRYVPCSGRRSVR